MMLVQSYIKTYTHTYTHTHILAYLCYRPLTCDDVDIDECALNNGGCSSSADCTDTDGSFTCTCLYGYSGDGFNCTGLSDKNAIFIDNVPIL